MKTRYTLLLVPAALIPIALVAQGPLTPPPGPPAPQGKTLQQLEPRVDVVTLPGDTNTAFIISAPGSYYLSSNVNVAEGGKGIAIAASHVSLDLNGFAITGTVTSVRGVELRGLVQGVTIRSGRISGIIGGAGVGFLGAGATNVRLEDLTIYNCGSGVAFDNFNGVTAEGVRIAACGGSGLDLGLFASASHCVVESLNGSSAAGVFGIRAMMVTGCTVRQATNIAGPCTGISGNHVRDSRVNILSGTADSVAITGDVITHCSADNIRVTTGGTVRGIFCNGQVDNCFADFVGFTGPGTPTGIVGGIVSACNVSGVGNANSTGVITGINSVKSVSHCTVESVGATSAAVVVQGIGAPAVSHCTVGLLRASERINGINAETVTDCSVEGVTQGGASGQAVTGIVGVRIHGSRVESVSGASTVAATAFAGYRLASGCVAQTVSNSGGGSATGFASNANGQTLDCVVSAVNSFGVQGITGCVVKGCTIQLNNSGTGISAPGAGSVIENNTVSSCATGISASGANCLVVRNRLTLCTSNISSSVSSQTGPMIAATGSIASNNPWANFTD